MTIRFFRRFAAVSLAAAVLTGLCACSSNTQQASPSSPESTSSQTETPEEAYVTLGQYLGLEISAVTPEPVTEEDVENAIASTLSAHTTMEPVTDRGAQEGDTLTIDYVGTLDGVAFDGGTAEGQTITLGIGNGYIDGFSDGLLGATTGETVTLNLTFPDSYPNSPDLAGKDVDFTVTVQEILTSVTPVFDDEFVANNLTGFSTAAEYTEYLRQQLELSNQAEAEESLRGTVWDAVMAGVTIHSYPQDQIDQYLEDANAYYQQLADSNDITLEEMAENYYGMTTDELDAQTLAYAQEEIGYFLVVNAIAEAENLSISDEEYAEGLETYLSNWGYDNDEDFAADYGSSFEEYFGKEEILQYLLADKVEQYVLDAAVQVED